MAQQGSIKAQAQGFVFVCINKIDVQIPHKTPGHWTSHKSFVMSFVCAESLNIIQFYLGDICSFHIFSNPFETLIVTTTLRKELNFVFNSHNLIFRSTLLNVKL